MTRLRPIVIQLAPIVIQLAETQYHQKSRLRLSTRTSVSSKSSGRMLPSDSLFIP